MKGLLLALALLGAAGGAAWWAYQGGMLTTSPEERLARACMEQTARYGEPEMLGTRGPFGGPVDISELEAEIDRDNRDVADSPEARAAIEVLKDLWRDLAPLSRYMVEVRYSDAGAEVVAICSHFQREGPLEYDRGDGGDLFTLRRDAHTMDRYRREMGLD
ncbi:hypothetical protein LNKW23_18250 [Paralimibaculum aggregatum]|uniref:Uncharacterized protein n=1 Tax=Paralimibaculum aggregatum TaxID=3036245 RepID=A0ABQ6LLR2_9RHOB|nr:hypothetical protein [Limibaculum sp. NKW23]GMG82612.1 hypothetical protein LNKW23_18250 [Limibaculum sp. NKW23]